MSIWKTKTITYKKCALYSYIRKRNLEGHNLKTYVRKNMNCKRKKESNKSISKNKCSIKWPRRKKSAGITSRWIHHHQYWKRLTKTCGLNMAYAQWVNQAGGVNINVGSCHTTSSLASIGENPPLIQLNFWWLNEDRQRRQRLVTLRRYNQEVLTYRNSSLQVCTKVVHQYWSSSDHLAAMAMAFLKQESVSGSSRSCSSCQLPLLLFVNEENALV